MYLFGYVYAHAQNGRRTRTQDIASKLRLDFYYIKLQNYTKVENNKRVDISK